MKSIIATIALLFAFNALAADEPRYAYMKNEDGGHVYLIEEECQMDATKLRALAVSKDKTHWVEGCWQSVDGNDKVHIVWLEESIKIATPVHRVQSASLYTLAPKKGE